MNWRNNGSRKHAPADDPVITKSYFKLMRPDGTTLGFKKEKITLYGSKVPCIVHYAGDSGLIVPIAYGNAKNKDVHFATTQPSVLKAIKAGVVNVDPSKYYKSAPDVFRDLKDSGKHPPVNS